MIHIASIIKQFGNEFKQHYQNKLLPSHLKALSAMENCRSSHGSKMMMECDDCAHQKLIPHSCGHRSCPHCQNHETQQWIERQQQKLVPADYFMLTFTLPAEFRRLTWLNQRLVYGLLFECIWATLKEFTQNDSDLGGIPGAIAVLHTHARALNFHPHVHIVMPAGSIDQSSRLWRCKKWDKNTKKYLFNHHALAKVFRAKFLEALSESGLKRPSTYPTKWVVDCRHVGKGDKALVYLGRYLYRGVIQEKDILSCENGQVTFRYQNSKTKKYEIKTLSAVFFLWRVLQHILPRGFRRTRNYGFLHPNSKILITILQWVFRLNPAQWIAKIKPRPKMHCICCGGNMSIVRTKIPDWIHPHLLIPI